MLRQLELTSDISSVHIRDISGRERGDRHQALAQTPLDNKALWPVVYQRSFVPCLQQLTTLLGLNYDANAKLMRCMRVVDAMCSRSKSLYRLCSVLKARYVCSECLGCVRHQLRSTTWQT